MSVDFIDPLELVDAERYGRRGYPHELWTRLRTEAPVFRFEPPGFLPFWAITKHADIQHIASQPLRFSSANGITLARPDLPTTQMDILVAMDPPRHGPMRRVANPRFTARAVRARRAHIERLGVELLDEVAAAGRSGELDFVEQIAAPSRWPSSRGPSACRTRTSTCCSAGPTRSLARRTPTTTGAPGRRPGRR